MTHWINDRLRKNLSEFAIKQTTLDGYFYRSCFDFIEKEGVFYESKALTTNEAKFILKRMRSINSDFHKSYCFRNSMKMMLSDSDNKIGYVEGVICEKGATIHHAWNEINGKVVDTTLQKFGEFTGIAYYGVRIHNSNVRLYALRNDFLGSVIDDTHYRTPWPILKDKYHPDLIL